MNNKNSLNAAMSQHCGNALTSSKIVETTFTADYVNTLIAQLEAAQKERDDLREKVNQADSEWHKMADRILSAGKRAETAEAQLIKAEKGEVLVTVSGFTGCGKSAVAGEIEIALLAIGVPVRWTNGDAEKRMTGADYLTALEMYKPHVRIVERNIAGGKWYE